MRNLSWYRGKRVLITGHTGFKGSWLCKILLDAGALVTGFALAPPTEPNLFSLAGVESRMRSVIGDVRDLAHLQHVFEESRPELVFHLAAQPLVRASYERPAYTYETNVMGTVHVCECVRAAPEVRSFLNVTTDKVYDNREWDWGYRETDALDGRDPYSNSKSCSELVTHSYARSFLIERNVAVSTARAGNVIGGGDFAENRILPDCVRAVTAGKPIEVRNPRSVRPYQHVLEPLFAYLQIVRAQYDDREICGAYNVGPGEADCLTTGELAALFCEKWGEGAKWVSLNAAGPHEAATLRLDCSRLRSRLGWRPKWTAAKAVEKTVEWTKVWLNSPEHISQCMERQISAYLNS